MQVPMQMGPGSANANGHRQHQAQVKAAGRAMGGHGMCHF